MTIRLLSNVNVQPLQALLRPLDVSLGEYNSLLLELVNPESKAASTDVSHVLCLFDTDALFGDALYGLAEPRQAETLLGTLDAFCATHTDKVVVTNTFCAGAARVRTFGDVLHDGSLRALEAAMNARLLEIARLRPNLLLLDIELLFRRYGEDNLVNPAFWYTGRVRYTNLMFRALADYVKQALAAYSHQARKVLVLDLDNTLWGGVVGELGPHGIELAENGRGACFRDFQRVLKALKNTGVLLAICSKNNPADVDQVFESNPMMILAREDFACICANWQTKPENIVHIAHTLNLGLDSFVFVDDNPVERELVSAALPEVALPGFPERVEMLPTWFVRDVIPPYFGKYRITAEELGKTEQYRANDKRQGLAVRLDLDAFLDELNIDCKLMVDYPEALVRAAQMTQKTNQFNLTTWRCEVPDVARYIDSPDHALVLLDYADRFGSEGIVGLAMLELAEGRIANFLMSCRVIGRKVEDRLLDKSIELFRKRGVPRVVAEFIPSHKNQLVASFYETHGFELLAEHADGRRVYQRRIA